MNTYLVYVRQEVTRRCAVRVRAASAVEAVRTVRTRYDALGLDSLERVEDDATSAAIFAIDGVGDPAPGDAPGDIEDVSLAVNDPIEFR